MWSSKVEEHRQKIEAAAMKMFKEKQACRCCVRHQMNRPKDYWRYVDVPVSNPKIEKECLCNCRHVMRCITTMID